MIHLLATTLVWAFSFTLIGSTLKGIDPFLVATLRLALASLCFLPLLRHRALPASQRPVLLGIGALQFGCMYISYLSAFAHAPAYMVALFSSFTPLWIALLAALRHPAALSRLLLAGLLATGGALLIRAGQPLDKQGFWTAFVLMQASNLSFGAGQLAYRSWKLRNPAQRERDSFAWLYLGGLLLAGLFALARLLHAGQIPVISPLQFGVILYLGLVASGLGFFLWNLGASRVSTATLAAANNLVVPLGVLIALLFGNDRPRWIPLLTGAACITAALLLSPGSTSEDGSGFSPAGPGRPGTRCAPCRGGSGRARGS